MKNFISPSAILLAVVTFFAFSNTNAQSKNFLNTQDVLILKGKLVEAETLKPIQQSIVNLDLEESGMLLFDMDEKGNYLMVFNKEHLSFPFKMSFNFEGYEDFEAKKITAKDDFVKMDIELEPIKEQSTVQIPTKMKKWESNAVVSTTIIKMN
jgi:hypothetical protein